MGASGCVPAEHNAERLMADEAFTRGDTSEADLAVFADRLAALAATLSEREQQLLAILVARALDPIDRMRFFAAPTAISAREEAFVQALLDAD